MKKIILLLCILATLLPCFASNTLTVTQSAVDFGLNPASIRWVTMTPIAPAGDYGTNYLVAQPIQPSSCTNGVAVFTNIISGYAYRVAFISTSAAYRTNYFPTSLNGSVIGHDYTTASLGFAQDGSVINVYYLFGVSIATNVFLAPSDTTITVTTNSASSWSIKVSPSLTNNLASQAYVQSYSDTNGAYVYTLNRILGSNYVTASITNGCDTNGAYLWAYQSSTNYATTNTAIGGAWTGAVIASDNTVSVSPTAVSPGVTNFFVNVNSGSYYGIILPSGTSNNVALSILRPDYIIATNNAIYNVLYVTNTPTVTSNIVYCNISVTGTNVTLIWPSAWTPFHTNSVVTTNGVLGIKWTAGTTTAIYYQP